jgi:hypothetical protein
VSGPEWPTMVNENAVIGLSPQIRIVRDPNMVSYAVMRVEYAPSVVST